MHPQSRATALRQGFTQNAAQLREILGSLTNAAASYSWSISPAPGEVKTDARGPLKARRKGDTPEGAEFRKVFFSMAAPRTALKVANFDSSVFAKVLMRPQWTRTAPWPSRGPRRVHPAGTCAVLGRTSGVGLCSLPRQAVARRIRCPADSCPR